jgi:hypothetical protein
VFWSYERGTWPYDLLVAGIVLFVFLAPRSWLNDRPSVAPGAHSTEVELVSQDADGKNLTFRLDAHLLARPKPDPAFERQAHDFLGKNVAELKGRTFQITQIEAVRDSNGTVLYYEVSVKR